MSSEEEWSNAIKFITSFGKPLDNPIIEYAIATQKQTMDFVIKSQGQSNQTLENVFNNLITKIPELKSSITNIENSNSPNSQFQVGDNNSQTITIEDREQIYALLDKLQELTQNQNLKHSESSLSKELYEELHQVEKNKFSIGSVKEFGAKVINLQNLSAFATIYPFIKAPLDLLLKSYGIILNLP